MKLAFNLWTTACAGAGKTTLLVHRILKLCLSGVDPRTILCLTFTRKGVEALQEGLHQTLQLWKTLERDTLRKTLETLFQGEISQGIVETVRLLFEHPPRIAMQTFHGFCHGLLQQFSLEGGLSQPMGALIDKEEGEILWEKAKRKTLTAENVSRNASFFCDLQEMLGAFPENLSIFETLALETTPFVRLSKDSISTQRDPLHPLLFRLQQHYRSLVQHQYQGLKRGRLDMFELLEQTLRLLRQGLGWVSYTISKTVHHLLLDEAQDTHPLQWELLWHLMEGFWENPKKSLFVVGDPLQTIYGFQGVIPWKFHAMKRRLEHACRWNKRPFLEKKENNSFRCPSAVLTLVNTLFKQPLGDVPDWFQFEPKRSLAVHAGSVSLFHPFKDMETLATHWSSLCHAWISNPFFLQSMGRNLLAKDIMILFQKRTRGFHILKEVLHSKGLCQKALPSPLVERWCAIAKWLLYPWDDDALFSAVSLLETIDQSRLASMVYAITHQRRGEPLWKIFQILSKDFFSMEDAAIFSYLQKILHQYHQWHGQLLPWQWMEQERMRVYPKDLYASSFLEMLYPHAHEPLGTLFPIMKRYLFTQVEPIEDSLTLSTIHGAKGKEAAIVILPEIPNPQDEGYHALIYVALTRSKEHLYLSSVRDGAPYLWMENALKALGAVSQEQFGQGTLHYCPDGSKNHIR